MRPEVFKQNGRVAEKYSAPEKTHEVEAIFSIRRNELKPEVRSYADNLYTQIHEIYKKFGVKNHKEFETAARAGEVPMEELLNILTITNKLVEVLEKGGLPLWLEHLYEREKKWLKDFFGQNSEVPPIPSAITAEHVKIWERLGMELRYLPKIDMTEEKNFPGWKKKPGRRYTPNKSFGIEFYDDIDRIQSLPENQRNHNLQGLKPTELPGTWVLRDTRDKPNYIHASQQYANDSDIQAFLKEMAKQSIIDSRAGVGRRFMLAPRLFDLSRFWDEVKLLLKVDDIPGAVVRLPRVIEASILGQAESPNQVHEWCEEYHESGSRLHQGFYPDSGGSSYVSYGREPSDNTGFRPLVVFKSDA